MNIRIKAQLGRHRDRYGRRPLQLRILFARQQGILSSPFRLFDDQFDPLSGRVPCSAHNASDKLIALKANRWLNETIEKLRLIADEWSLHAPDPDIPALLQHLRAQMETPGFIPFLHEEIHRQQTAGHYGTAISYRSTTTAYAAFIRSRNPQQQSDIPTSELCAGFEDFLFGKGLAANTIGYYMRTLRALYNKYLRHHPAIHNETSIFPSPARFLSPTLKRALPTDALRKIAEAPIPDHSPLALSRDLFMFSFYARGMSFVDMAYLSRNDLHDNEIRYRRRKTGQFFAVEITLPLRTILDRYHDPQSPYLLPILKGSESPLPPDKLYLCYKQQLSKHLGALKRLSEKLNLPALSFNCARHSWATLARDCGIPLPVISASLGHTSERTTHIYIKELDAREIHLANQTIQNLLN